MQTLLFELPAGRSALLAAVPLFYLLAALLSWTGAVDVRWHDGGWSVVAGSVENPYGWRGCSQVFSRNSVLESSEPSAPAQA